MSVSPPSVTSAPDGAHPAVPIGPFDEDPKLGYAEEVVVESVAYSVCQRIRVDHDDLEQPESGVRVGGRMLAFHRSPPTSGSCAGRPAADRVGLWP
jgi:hypothetical protein